MFVFFDCYGAHRDLHVLTHSFLTLLSSVLSNSALGSAIGGTAADNTMAALLAQLGSNDLAATLAGVRASATQTAAEIARGNVATAAGVNQNTAGTVAEIGNLLKGATTTTSQQSLEEQIA